MWLWDRLQYGAAAGARAAKLGRPCVDRLHVLCAQPDICERIRHDSTAKPGDIAAEEEIIARTSRPRGDLTICEM